MFDFRYHALSLVAVFVALALGLLLGVAIGDRGLVSSAEKDLRGSLRRNVVEARADASRARRALADRTRTDEKDLYPLLVDNRLSGARIGLVGLGGVPDRIVDLTRRALDNSGARVVSVSVVAEPLDLAAIDEKSKGTELAGLTGSLTDVRRLGRSVGENFVGGGKLVGRLRPALLRRGSSSGGLDGLDGVVLVHAPPALLGDEAKVAAAFENGFVAGMNGGDVSVVGVETEHSTPSSIPWFQARRVSSVDSLDRFEGRAALVFALGGERGAFGVKKTADAVLPSVVGRNQR